MYMMNEKRFLIMPFRYFMLILTALFLSACSISSLGTLASTSIEKTTDVFSCSESSEVFISTSRVFYNIAGSTADQLRSQMNQHGYRDDDGNHWDAYTDWYVSWSYTYSQNTEGCSAVDIQVEVDITFIFPIWDMPSNVSQDLATKWDDYVTSLQIHEDGHRDIAVQAACGILEELNSLQSYGYCSEFEQAADVTAEQILNLYREMESDYDQETGHGLSQGVSFP
jgi:predicted secreted Zn-dependent protease